MMRIKGADRIGTTVNGFKIHDHKRENGSTYYLVECPLCGTKKWTRSQTVLSGKSVSCGCHARQKAKKISPRYQVDITGQTFGELTAKEKLSGNGSMSIWRCECTCGNKDYKPYMHQLLLGYSKSCGCKMRGDSAGRIKKSIGLTDGTSISRIASKKLPKTNTSGVRGVSFAKNVGKYHAYIQFKGKLINLGYYDTLEEAANIRRIAEENIFGNFLEWHKKKFPPK